VEENAIVAERAVVSIAGITTISERVVGSIVGIAAREVEGVYALGASGVSSVRRTLAERLGGAPEKARGVNVEVGLKEVIINIELRVIYGYNIPKIAVKVCQNVADKVRRLCGLVAKQININVIGIEFPEKMPVQIEVE
jgi:uncharacterized alkaline shock family protein YloU